MLMSWEDLVSGSQQHILAPQTADKRVSPQRAGWQFGSTAAGPFSERALTIDSPTSNFQEGAIGGS